MSYDKYYSEGKYRCNHPDSDFSQTTTNPIEMKKEHFVEYTHRNETANYRYDVWTGSENASGAGYEYSRLNKPADYYSTSRPASNYAKTYSTSRTNNKKHSSSLSIVFIFILIYILPVIFSVLGVIINAIADML